MVNEERSPASCERNLVPASSGLPELSLCIVNWNCSDYLRELLASIQSDAAELAVEIIVVDNASTDDSASMVASEFPDVHLIRHDHHEGVAKSNNQAAARARGKLLLFLNNDTIIRPGALATLVHFFEQHAECSAVGPSLIFPGGKPQGCVRKSLSFQALLHHILFLRGMGLFRAADHEYKQTLFDLTQSAYVDHIVGPALLVRRQQFMSIGGWDEAFEFRMDDVDLSARMSRFGKMYYLAEAQVVHWGGVAAKLDEAYAYSRSECSHVIYARKYFGSSAARIYKILVTVDMPVRVFVLALTWLVKWLFGDRERASRDYGKLAAASRFLARGLPHFWRF